MKYLIYWKLFTDKLPICLGIIEISLSKKGCLIFNTRNIKSQIFNLNLFIELKIGDGSQFDCLFESESRNVFAKCKTVATDPLRVKKI